MWMADCWQVFESISKWVDFANYTPVLSFLDTHETEPQLKLKLTGCFCQVGLIESSEKTYFR